MFANILKFGWRNLLRNKRRSALTLLSVVVGVMSLIFAGSYIKGIINNASETTIKTMIGHVRIAHEEYLRLERIFPKEYLVTDLNQLQDNDGTIPGIEAVDRRIKLNVMLSHDDVTEMGVAIGIEPSVVDKTMELSKAIVEGTYFGSSEKGQDLIIGKKLAKKLGVTINDELLLVTTDINYSTYALPFKIAGIFETGFGGMDKHTLYIPLHKAQEMLDCGDGVHEILVFLKDPALSWTVSEKIKQLLAQSETGDSITVTPWQRNDLIESLPTVVAIFDKITMIIMFIVALVILNTMLMSVMERYHEIGVIKALGFKNKEIFSMILVEAFYLGSIGSIIGGILGGTLAAIIEKIGIDMTALTGGFIDKLDIPVPFVGKVLYPDLTFSNLFGSMIFGTVVALIAVLYPAFKSARMQPVEAFRSELKV